MLFKEKPKHFRQIFEASGCFIEHQGKFILLQRAQGKLYEKAWQLPGGKHEKGEIALEAVMREIREELGFDLPVFPELVESFFVRYPEFDYIYNVFRTTLDKKLDIQISPDHIDFAWLSPEESLGVLLMPDQDAVIKKLYKI